MTETKQDPYYGLLPFNARISRRTAIGAGGAVVAVVAAGAAGSYFFLTPREVPVERRKITIAMMESIKNVNPLILTESLGPNAAYFAIFNTLFLIGPPESDGKRRTHPILASSAENVDGDLSRTRITLRPNIRFHNGEKLTADAIKHTTELYSSKPSRRFDFRFLTGVTVEDELNAVLKWKFPSPSNLARMKNLRNWLFPLIFSPNQSHEDLSKNPIGTGPFKFKEFVPGVRLTLTRNQDYFGDSLPDADRWAYFSQTGNVEEVNFITIKEPTAMVTALETGEIDLAYSFSADQAIAVKNNPKLDLVTPGPAGVRFIHFNSTVKPLDDVRVRQALSHAADRKGIVSLYGNLWEEAKGLLPRGARGYDPNQQNYAFDIKKGKSLLADAGLKDGFDSEIYTTASGYDPKRVDQAQAFSFMVKKIGVNLKVTVVDPSTFTKSIRPPKSTIPMHPFALAANSLTVFFIAYTKRTFLLKHADYPGLDKLYAAADRATDDKQDDLLRQINKVGLDLAAQAYLTEMGPLRGAVPRLEVNQWDREVFLHVNNISVKS